MTEAARDTNEARGTNEAVKSGGRALLSRAELRDWLVTYVSKLLGIQRAEVDPAKSLELYGIDSSGAVGMSGDLEELLGAQFDTSLVYDYPTIDALVDHLASRRLLNDA